MGGKFFRSDQTYTFFGRLPLGYTLRWGSSKEDLEWKHIARLLIDLRVKIGYTNRFFHDKIVGKGVLET
ncbi:hypothetical protein NEPTK9_000820 [Candidatus Neptunochlamydia vexilliferae]|uniref:Uncharacterized protein n=1 Tax=Candidatus Neptunichlamydia vexilliferae TaxID=1651774 RepID=A0ABS0AZD7_9BACT|nr:hypothetical protein [Candidatus Neptunochlamydia vexilliferae]